MKLFKKATITAALVTMALAPVLTLTPATATQAVGPASVSVEQQSVAPNASRGGVRMLVRNHTTKLLLVCDRNNPDQSMNLEPGQWAPFYGPHRDGYDDLELSVHIVGKTSIQKVMEIDGANPTLAYPNVHLTPIPNPDGRSDLRWFREHEGDLMLDGRVWVKRFNDDGDNNKQFDIDIKKAY